MDKKRKPLTKEEVEAYKRRVYNFGNIERFMRGRIGACDRYGKQPEARER